jgi:hypothetical protein
MRPETPDDRVIDAVGMFILPGLMAAHCHISLYQGALPGKYTSTASLKFRRFGGRLPSTPAFFIRRSRPPPLLPTCQAANSAVRSIVAS